jgi:tetratricopeptide (TPR) repeat protein
MRSTLSLPLRLRRAFFFALILGLWAPFKIVWEQRIAREQDQLRYQGVTMTRQLRDQLGQGLTIGVLSGMRNVVADFVWLEVTVAWQDEQWFKMEGYINLCTALQPRAITFWDLGGWQLAWNASVGAMQDLRQPDPLRRLRASRFWIQKGLEIYKRGIENNPEHYLLWAHTGLLYQQRLADDEKRRGLLSEAAADYKLAAYYYQQASDRPDAPSFYERFPAYMYHDAGDDQDEYQAWRSLWFRLTPAQRKLPEHWADKVESNIRRLEAKLSIPPQKRVFPN